MVNNIEFNSKKLNLNMNLEIDSQNESDSNYEYVGADICSNISFAEEVNNKASKNSFIQNNLDKRSVKNIKSIKTFSICLS